MSIHWMEKAIIFLFVKAITGINIYFFSQYIEVCPFIFFLFDKLNYISLFIKKDSIIFIILFSIMYGIERIVSCILEISALKTKKWESLLIIILSPLQLEEIYFLLKHKKHEKYISQGIIAQACVILMFHSPINILAIIWVFTNDYVILNVKLLTLNLFALFVGPYTLSFVYLINSNQMSHTLYEYCEKLFSLVYSFFHFYSCFWGICLVSKYYNFGLYLLAAYGLLITLFILYLKRRIYNLSINVRTQVAQMFVFILKQIFHIVIERRLFDKNYTKHRSSQSGIKLYNSMTLFEFGLKLYLFGTSIAIICENHIRSEKLYIFQLTVLALVFFSTLLLGIQVVVYILPRVICQRKYVEIDDIGSFLKKSCKNKTGNKKSSIEKIIVFDRDYEPVEQQKENILRLALFEYEKSEIIYRYLLRQRGTIKKGNFVVQINYEIGLSSVVKILSTGEILPQITRINFVQSPEDNIKDLFQFQIDNHITQQLITSFDGNYPNHIKIVNEKKMAVKSTILQLLVYKKRISSEQICNPHLIYYDLFISPTE